MKIIKTEISPRQHSYISVETRDEAFFQSPFHYHPEIELVYITESYGKRIIGNSVEYFEQGDMVLLGPNLPHIWLNDEAFSKGSSPDRARAIVLYFNTDIFSHSFYEMSETRKLAHLFQHSLRGLKITGTTNTQIAEKLQQLTSKTDVDLLVGLLDILSTLAKSSDMEFINKECYANACEHQRDRISNVLHFVKKNYKEDITLTCVSKIAHLTPQSFCRLFRKRMHMHFKEYLNDVRISNACLLLLETENSISEVAYQCGYRTVSNFNKLFKKTTGTTPKLYKNQPFMLERTSSPQRLNAYSSQDKRIHRSIRSPGD